MGWVVNATPPLFYPRERDPVSIVQEAGGPQARSGKVRKISHSPGFDSRTVQPTQFPMQWIAGLTRG